MIKKVILSIILSLITILSFSIVNRDCSSNLYGIFSIWLMETTGFHEYSFFIHGFLINCSILCIFYFLFFYFFKRKISNKLIFILVITLAGLCVHFVFKTVVRIHMDSRNLVPKEFIEDTIDKKITFFLINKDMQCPD